MKFRAIPFPSSFILSLHGGKYYMAYSATVIHDRTATKLAVFYACQIGGTPTTTATTAFATCTGH